MAFTPITVTREYLQPNLQPAAGKITFVPTAPMVNDGTVVAAPATFQLASGLLTAVLAANDDPDTLPVNVAYVVREQIEGQPDRRYYVEIPSNAAGGTVDLSTLAAVGSPPTIVFPAPAYTDEQVRDVMGAVLVAGRGMGIAVDDGANTITVSSDPGWYNVRDFGAVGNGIADDTAAVAAAMDAARMASSRRGGTVFLPAGRYLVSEPISLFSAVSVVGEGWSLDSSFYNVSALVAADDFVGSAILLQDPDGETVFDPTERPDESWHWGVIEKLLFLGNGTSGPHGIDPGWGGEASVIRNCSFLECNSGIYLNDVQASTQLEAVSMFACSIGLNCDDIAGTVRVHGISGDNNTHLIRVEGGISANVTVLGMKAESYDVGTGDPVILLEDLEGGAFTLIGGWADTDGARDSVIRIDQPGASGNRPRVLVMGFESNSLYTNLIEDTFDDLAVPRGYGLHRPFVAYNLNFGVLGAGSLGIGYGRTITGTEFGGASSMNLVSSGADNGTVFHAGTGSSGGRLMDNTFENTLIQWRASGANNLGFFGVTPVTRPTVTGSRGGNAALASLLTQLAALGLVVDGTSA